jgi:hypothetical protein
MFLRNLLTLLAAFFTLGNAPDPDPDNPDPGAGGDEGGEADDPDGIGDLGDEDPDNPDGDGGDGDADDPDQTKAQLAAERRGRETAEREAREAKERLTALERARNAPAAQPNREQQQFEEEERILKDAATTDLQRWQIESNRTMRANNRAAQQMLWQSQENSDKASFQALCGDKPLAKKYAQRVEEKLAEIRQGGANLERKLVLKMLIGDDIVEGRVKTSAKKKDSAGNPAPKPADGVPRGKPAMGRSDVRARPGNSERDKRRARLDGQLI